MELTLDTVQNQERLYNELVQNSEKVMLEIGSKLNQEEDDFLCYHEIKDFLEANGIRHFMYVPTRKIDITYHDDFRNKCFNQYFNSLPKTA